MELMIEAKKALESTVLELETFERYQSSDMDMGHTWIDVAMEHHYSNNKPYLDAWRCFWNEVVANQDNPNQVSSRVGGILHSDKLQGLVMQRALALQRIRRMIREEWGSDIQRIMLDAKWMAAFSTLYATLNFFTTQGITEPIDETKEALKLESQPIMDDPKAEGVHLKKKPCLKDGKSESESESQEIQKSNLIREQERKRHEREQRVKIAIRSTKLLDDILTHKLNSRTDPPPKDEQRVVVIGVLLDHLTRAIKKCKVKSTVLTSLHKTLNKKISVSRFNAFVPCFLVKLGAKSSERQNIKSPHCVVKFSNHIITHVYHPIEPQSDEPDKLTEAALAALIEKIDMELPEPSPPPPQVYSLPPPPLPVVANVHNPYQYDPNVMGVHPYNNPYLYPVQPILESFSSTPSHETQSVHLPPPSLPSHENGIPILSEVQESLPTPEVGHQDVQKEILKRRREHALETKKQKNRHPSQITTTQQQKKKPRVEFNKVHGGSYHVVEDADVAVAAAAAAAAASSSSSIPCEEDEGYQSPATPDEADMVSDYDHNSDGEMNKGSDSPPYSPSNSQYSPRHN